MCTVGKRVQGGIFSPAAHICVHSAHATLAGAPLSQCSLLWSQTLWDKHTWRAPSGNTANDIHDHRSQAIGSQTGLILKQDLPKTWTGSDQYMVHHTPSMCIFSWRHNECQVKRASWSKFKNPDVHRSAVWWGKVVAGHTAKTKG